MSAPSFPVSGDARVAPVFLGVNEFDFNSFVTRKRGPRSRPAAKKVPRFTDDDASFLADVGSIKAKVLEYAADAASDAVDSDVDDDEVSLPSFASMFAGLSSEVAASGPAVFRNLQKDVSSLKALDFAGVNSSRDATDLAGRDGVCVRVSEDTILMPAHVFKMLPSLPVLHSSQCSFFLEGVGRVTGHVAYFNTYSDTAELAVFPGSLDCAGMRIHRVNQARGEVVDAEVVHHGLGRDLVLHSLDSSFYASENVAHLAEGDSGTPAFDESGRVVAIFVGYQPSTGYAIWSRPTTTSDRDIRHLAARLALVECARKTKKAGKRVGSEFYEKARNDFIEEFGRTPTLGEHLTRAAAYEADAEYYEETEFYRNKSTLRQGDDDFDDDFMANEPTAKGDAWDYDAGLGMSESVYLFGVQRKNPSGGPTYRQSSKEGELREGYDVSLPAAASSVADPVQAPKKKKISPAVRALMKTPGPSENLSEPAPSSSPALQAPTAQTTTDADEYAEFLAFKKAKAAAAVAPVAPAPPVAAVAQKGVSVTIADRLKLVEAEISALELAGTRLETMVSLTAEEEVKFPPKEHALHLAQKKLRQLKARAHWMKTRQDQQAARIKEAKRVQAVVDAKVKEIAELREKLEKLTASDADFC